jgi:hypothetical protein
MSNRNINRQASQEDPKYGRKKYGSFWNISGVRRRRKRRGCIESGGFPQYRISRCFSLKTWARRISPTRKKPRHRKEPPQAQLPGQCLAADWAGWPALVLWLFRDSCSVAQKRQAIDGVGNERVAGRWARPFPESSKDNAMEWATSYNARLVRPTVFISDRSRVRDWQHDHANSLAASLA